MHPHEYAKIRAASGSTDPRAFGLVKVAYSVNETLQLLSIGRTSLYEAAKRGDLKLVKLGKKTLVYAADIVAFLTQLRGAR
jgi:excisionase family DNA binding protein